MNIDKYVTETLMDAQGITLILTDGTKWLINNDPLSGDMVRTYIQEKLIAKQEQEDAEHVREMLQRTRHSLRVRKKEVKQLQAAILKHKKALKRLENLFVETITACNKNNCSSKELMKLINEDKVDFTPFEEAIK